MGDLYCRTGDGRAPTAVFLHEGAGAAAMWDRPRQAVATESGRATLAYDRRGFGASPHSASFAADHFDQAADDLVQLLAELGAAPVDLVGHSDGGSVALLVAARRPELVRSVVVVATHVYADEQTVAAVRALGAPETWDAAVRARYETLHGADWAAVVGRWLRMWTDPGGVREWDMRAELAGVAAPVLVVHERADPLSPEEHARTIAARVPRAEVTWYDGQTHRPQVAHRERFAREVSDFWARVGD